MYTDRWKTTVQRRTRMLNFKKSLSLKISRITPLEIHWASNLPALHFHEEKNLGFFGWDHLGDKENGANTALWVRVNDRKYLSWFGQYKPFSFVTAPFSMDELLHATSKFNKSNHAMILAWLRSYWNAVSTSWIFACWKNARVMDRCTSRNPSDPLKSPQPEEQHSFCPGRCAKKQIRNSKHHSKQIDGMRYAHWDSESRSFHRLWTYTLASILRVAQPAPSLGTSCVGFAAPL